MNSPPLGSFIPIGQTRDVHIYRLISHHTVEENILQKSRRKRLLDRIVIQEGNFNSDWFQQRQLQHLDVNALMENQNNPQENDLNRIEDWKDLFSELPATTTTTRSDASSPHNSAEANSVTEADTEQAMMNAEMEDERDIIAIRNAKDDLVRAESDEAILSVPTTPIEADSNLQSPITPQHNFGHIDDFMIKVMERELVGEYFVAIS